MSCAHSCSLPTRESSCSSPSLQGEAKDSSDSACEHWGTVDGEGCSGATRGRGRSSLIRGRGSLLAAAAGRCGASSRRGRGLSIVLDGLVAAALVAGVGASDLELKVRVGSIDALVEPKAAHVRRDGLLVFGHVRDVSVLAFALVLEGVLCGNQVSLVYTCMVKNMGDIQDRKSGLHERGC